MTYADALWCLALLCVAFLAACLYTLASEWTLTERRDDADTTYWLGREPITRADYNAISAQRRAER